MDKNQTAAAIAVMKAFSEGKKIESRARSNDRWYINDLPRWNWETIEYRVAITPSMVYVIRNADGCPVQACDTLQFAQDWLESYNKHGLVQPYTMESYKQVME